MAQDLDARAAVFAALGEPVRLALVDRLVVGDASPGELAAAVGWAATCSPTISACSRTPASSVGSGLKVIGDAATSNYGLTTRPSGRPPSPAACPTTSPTGPRWLFVCTANSARSQLAAAIWNQLRNIPATSAGTHPGRRIHPRAVAVAERHGLRIDPNRPKALNDVLHDDDLIVAVCDNAHEELGHRFRGCTGRSPTPYQSIPTPPSSAPTPTSTAASTTSPTSTHQQRAHCDHTHLEPPQYRHHTRAPHRRRPAHR